MTPERRKRLTDVLSKRQNDITVVLENVFDPHNVSAVMRTCDAVGIQDIYILNSTVAPRKKWGFRSSSTASKWLTVHQFTNASDCFSSVKEKYKNIFAGHLGEGSRDLYDLDFSKPMALVFGNETLGISEDVMKYMDGFFIIPQVGIIKSLNISVACAITLYEAMRQKRLAGHYDYVRLPEADYKRIMDQWGLEGEE
ncbi:MAG: RNA methyltransferase [Chitinophagaceae bacterium]|nr:RNA methyltransferase [Chitinophagaceae bacterium]